MLNPKLRRALNPAPRSSPPLAIHLYERSELAAGQGFLILLTHVRPTPGRFKAVCCQIKPNIFKDCQDNTWLSKLPTLRAENKIKRRFQDN